MDALEFARELKRMCESYPKCKGCPIEEAGISCSIYWLEELLPFVEKWSTEHPKVTNLDHVAEGLEKLGYEVDKERLRNTCPTFKSNHYPCGCFGDNEAECTDCRKWWDEEYKEQKE